MVAHTRDGDGYDPARQRIVIRMLAVIVINTLLRIVIRPTVDR